MLLNDYMIQSSNDQNYWFGDIKKIIPFQVVMRPMDLPASSGYAVVAMQEHIQSLHESQAAGQSPKVPRESEEGTARKSKSVKKKKKRTKRSQSDDSP